MTEADKEIILILKELFRNKDCELIDPDELLRDKIVKGVIYLAILSLITLVPLLLIGVENDQEIRGILSGVIGVAFTLLFIHLNIKSKNPSIIMYLLTWLSLMVSLWLAS